MWSSISAILLLLSKCLDLFDMMQGCRILRISKLFTVLLDFIFKQQYSAKFEVLNLYQTILMNCLSVPFKINNFLLYRAQKIKSFCAKNHKTFAHLLNTFIVDFEKHIYESASKKWKKKSLLSLYYFPQNVYIRLVAACSVCLYRFYEWNTFLPLSRLFQTNFNNKFSMIFRFCFFFFFYFTRVRNASSLLDNFHLFVVFFRFFIPFVLFLHFKNQIIFTIAIQMKRNSCGLLSLYVLPRNISIYQKCVSNLSFFRVILFSCKWQQLNAHIDLANEIWRFWRQTK